MVYQIRGNGARRLGTIQKIHPTATLLVLVLVLVIVLS